MRDLRLSIVERRFRDVGRILAYASGKGGVGKSCCAAVSALLFAKMGLRVGLLDLDFHGASDHLILGIQPELPGEQGGITPIAGPLGIRYMGVAPFTRERGLALRGAAVTDAIRELFAVVVWDEIDVLVVDMPPGMGEAVLDLSRQVARTEALLITTPSTLSQRVAARLVEVLHAAHVPIVGTIVNMARESVTASSTTPSVPAPKDALIAPVLARIPFSEELERDLGEPNRLVTGTFAAALEPALSRLAAGLGFAERGSPGG